MYRQAASWVSDLCKRRPPIRKGPARGLFFFSQLLELLIIFEQAVLHFHFSLRPANYVASSLYKILLGVTEIVFLGTHELQLFNNDFFSVCVQLKCQDHF